MAGEVLSYADDTELAGELAGAGEIVAKALGGSSSAVELDEVRAGAPLGRSVLLVTGDEKLGGSTDRAAGAIVEVAKARSSRVILVGATRFGRVVAAKVAVRLRAGSLGTAKHIELEGDALVARREVYAGKFVAEVGIKLPCVALLQAGAYRPSSAAPASIETVHVAAEGSRVKLVETKQGTGNSVDLRSASIIVSAGRGVAKKEDLALVEELAKAMGAAVGCSRPLSSDLGWLGEEHHIGLTGVYVHPKLYLAVGISGQLQHVAGIKDSKIIVAINKDKLAPIFDVADYGIVGDLYQVVPALTRVLSRG